MLDVVANDPTNIELEALDNGVDEKKTLPRDAIEVAHQEELGRHKVSPCLGDARHPCALDVLHSPLYKWNSDIGVAEGLNNVLLVDCPAEEAGVLILCHYIVR